MKIPKSDRYGQHHDWDCGFQKNMWNYPSYHMHNFKALEKLINTYCQKRTKQNNNPVYSLGKMNGMLNGKLVSSELSVRYFLCGGHTLKHSAELETEN